MSMFLTYLWRKWSGTWGTWPKKRRVDVDTVVRMFRLVVEGARVVFASVYGKYLREAAGMVRDVKDAPYVAVALYLLEKFESVTILTFNIRDYDVRALKNKGVVVKNP